MIVNHSRPPPSARAYDVMQLTKQALDAIVARLPTVALLSSRIQREEGGYGLRSSIACLPDYAQDCACWDLFKKGYCPRRDQCKWYHPHGSDITKIKVSVRYAQEVRNDQAEEILTAVTMRSTRSSRRPALASTSRARCSSTWSRPSSMRSARVPTVSSSTRSS